MKRRIAIGIMLAIAGAAMFIVSIWLLADTAKNPRIPGLIIGPGNSPKVGIAAGIAAVIVALVCCFLTEIEKKKAILVGAIVVLLILSLVSLGLAIQDRLDIKKIEDAKNLAKQGLSGNIPGFSINENEYNRKTSDENIKLYEDQLNLFIDPEALKKFKTQVTVMAVAAGVAAILEIVAAVLAAKLRPDSESRNAMRMERSFY